MKNLLKAGVILLVFLLSGCAKKDEGKKIVIWHWMSDRQAAFEKLAKEYESETGIKVHFEALPSPAVYSQKIQAAAAAKSLPDLFGVLGGKKEFAYFIKGGYVENLTPYLEENHAQWKRKFIPIALNFNYFSQGNSYGVTSGYYAIPIDSMSIQLIYNKDLLKKAGYEKPPAGWSDFLAAAKKVSLAKGVYGFVCGWGENWLIYCLVTNYAFNIMGKDKFFATLKGEVPYTDSDWVKVFSLFKEMKDAGILAPGIVTMTNKEAEQMFSYDKAAFTFNGSWGVNTYAQMNKDLHYDTMPLPRLESKFVPLIWAGAGSSFVVNSASPLKKEAVKFLQWLTQKKQQLFLIKETRNLPSIKGCEKEISPNMQAFLKNLKNSTHPNIWPLNEEPRVIEAINIGVQKMVIGEKTPEEIAQEVEAAKQRALTQK